MEEKLQMSIKVTNPDTIFAIRDDMNKRGIDTNKEWLDVVVQENRFTPIFEYGDTAIDIVTGFKGIVTGFENYYDQIPNRYLVESGTDRRWISETRLISYLDMLESEDK